MQKTLPLPRGFVSGTLFTGHFICHSKVITLMGATYKICESLRSEPLFVLFLQIYFISPLSFPLTKFLLPPVLNLCHVFWHLPTTALPWALVEYLKTGIKFNTCVHRSPWRLLTYEAPGRELHKDIWAREIWTMVFVMWVKLCGKEIVRSASHFLRRLLLFSL